MRLLILSTAMTGILLSSGCATIKNPQETQAWLTKNEKVVKAGVQTVRRLAVRYGTDNPDQAAQVNEQINVVAGQVSALLAQGDFDPDSVTAALKVKEPYVADALEAVGLIYAAAYDELASRDQGQLAIILLRAIADGLATQKPSPVAGVGIDWDDVQPYARGSPAMYYEVTPRLEPGNHNAM